VANVVELSLAMLDSVDTGRVSDSEDSKRVGVFPETSETRSVNNEDIESETWEVSRPGDRENLASGADKDSVETTWDSVTGANDGVDEDPERVANELDIELDESEGGTGGETTDEEDIEIEGDESWNVEEMRRDVMGTMDGDDQLRGWELSYESDGESSYLVKSQKWNPGFSGSFVVPLSVCSMGTKTPR